MNWQDTIPGFGKTFTYKGFDVSPVVIESARAKHPDVDFAVLDLVNQVPPRADLVITRDCIQHLPLIDGLKAIENVRLSRAKYFAVSTYPDTKKNVDIPL